MDTLVNSVLVDDSDMKPYPAAALARLTSEIRGKGPNQNVSLDSWLIGAINAAMQHAAYYGSCEYDLKTPFDAADQERASRIRDVLVEAGYGVEESSFSRGEGTWGLRFTITWSRAMS